ncbi:MAG TPA: type II toxin-antitoxin system VapC family toxin [Gemmataceae bacterium]|jgi:tRNA(fMet)-specific endonuclease VapC|nr:type II toxin-antitoxin system VapC family toxin [Gemmataceae bacterium]
MPVILDTDHLSVLQWQEQPACGRLLERLDQLPPDDIATTIVSFHEQVQGWLAYLNRARKPEQVVLAYAKLEAMWRSFLKMIVLSYTEKAQERFAELRRQCPRLQTMDLRIASITLVTGATLLSRNLRDFSKVPGLTVEDWTV